MPITIDDGVTKTLSGTGLSLFTGVTVPEGVTSVAGGLLFDLPITGSIVPILAEGSDTPTSSRISLATFKDFEGLSKTVLSGETRLQGSREVQNLLDATEDLTNAAWFAANGAVIDNATEVSFPVGTNTRLQQTITIIDDGSGANARQFVLSVDIRLVSGTINANADVVITIGGNAIEFVDIDIGDQVNSTVKRFTVIAATDLAGTQVIPAIGWNANNPGTLEITRCQVEEVSGQSNQDPGDYVSEGVESYPYHGTGVDGTQAFTTENGNTVVNNVVTEAEGSDLTTLKGYLAESIARTNMVWPSEDFNHGNWMTVNTTVSVNNGSGPDGKQTANIFTFNGGGFPCSVFGTSATFVMGDPYALSVFVKFIDQQWIQLSSNANFFPATDFANFDVQNGVVGGSSGMILDIEPFVNGWYRISATHTATSGGVGVNAIDIAGVDNSSSIKGSPLTAVVATKVEVLGGSFEKGDFASTYIQTITGPVIRNPDVLDYPVLDNFDDTKGTAVATVEATDWSNINAGTVLGDGQAFPLGITFHNGGVIISDVQTNGFGPSGVPSGSINIACVWGEGQMQAFSNGVGGTPVAYDGAFDLSKLGIGLTGFFGTIKDLKIFNRQLTQSELESL